MMLQRALLTTVLVLLCPGICLAEVTLAWDREDPPSANGYYIYQSTTAPSSWTESRVISTQLKHSIVTSPYSIYMDDNYVDGGVAFADSGTPLLRETTPALVVSDDAPENVASSEFYYHIAGVQYSKAAVPAGTAPGDDVIPQGKYGAVALDIGADGTIDVIEATSNATGYDSAALAVAGIPAAASDHVRMGTVTATKSDSNFTFGATPLNQTNVTAAITHTPITLDAGEYELFWIDNEHCYIFHPSDAGKAVDITYTYTPLVPAYETHVVPSDKKVSLAYKPATTTPHHRKARRSGQKDLLTTAAIDTNTGIATFDDAEVGASVDLFYVHAQPARTKTDRVTIPSTTEISVLEKSIWTSDTSVTAYDAVRLYGLNTATTASKLIDSTADFTGGTPVQNGDTVVNRETGSTATVTNVDSATQLSLSANIFPFLSTSAASSYHIYATSTAASCSKVANNPATGQYAVDNGSGKYTFSAADAGKVVQISYNYLPWSSFTRRLKVPGGVTTCKLRNPAGTYYVRATAVGNATQESDPSNMVSYTQETDDATTNPLRVGNRYNMQNDNPQTVTVGY